MSDSGDTRLFKVGIGRRRKGAPAGVASSRGSSLCLRLPVRCELPTMDCARPSSARVTGIGTLMLALLAAGCGGSSRPSTPLARWLSSNASNKIVTLTLVPAANHVYNGFNFNGYGKGQVLVTVPSGWRVAVHCLNNVSSSRHSCAIVAGANATGSAFPGAATPAPTVGLAPGRQASFSFVASRSGVYRIACLVPGYGRAGMWDVFQVGPGPRPSVTLLRAYPG